MNGITAAALLLRILKDSGQKRFDEIILWEKQSLWNIRMMVLRAANKPVTTRFLSFESFPY